MDEDTRNKLDKIFENLREEFLVIGLTGAVGSGCSEAAQILSQEHLEFPLCHQASALEYRRALRIHSFYKKEGWKKFITIKVSNILLCLFVWGAKKSEDHIHTHIHKMLTAFAQKILAEANAQKILAEAKEEKIEEIFKGLTDEEFKNLVDWAKNFIEFIKSYYTKEKEIKIQKFQKLLSEINLISKKLNKKLYLYSSFPRDWQKPKDTRNPNKRRELKHSRYPPRTF